MRRTPTVDLQLTAGQLDAMKASERAIADRKADHVKVFMERHGQEAVERVCYFGVESLSVKQAAEVAGVRFLST